MKVALIDYGAGNLRSVANALRELGVEPIIAAAPEALTDCTHLILPGVGSFGDSMAQLEKRGLVPAIRSWVEAGKPYLGICLGYQLLFDSSEESPGVEGLGLVPGTVRRFQQTPGLKIPHMGWNSAVPRNPENGHWQGLGAEPYFYFVHSFFPAPADDSVIAAETTYGADTFAAAIELPNLLACQFHPEKSQDAGLRLIRNFLGQ
ncbi:MAG: imidazole glycerol phosphate synthase subunit HisH [Verrucomicrobiaceae bacterium]|nr:MAG: imidazole glycerol phosphate synthase subunit HisH [Verrucomicrobiaceae bacterium]